MVGGAEPGPGGVTRPGTVAPVVGTWSARAKSPAVANRSLASRLSALMTAASTAAGTVGRSTRTDGAGPANRLAMTACDVRPVNGGSPASIS